MNVYPQAAQKSLRKAVKALLWCVGRTCTRRSRLLRL